MAQRQVFQFKISLQEVDPVVWRRIQVSDLCSFWDLHVAIQDAMGWTDTHLHHFEMNHSIKQGKQYMGIPADDDYDVLNTLPGWDYKVKDYLIINQQFFYAYDYGDGWKHLIEFEGLHEKQPDLKYPVCITGERACPPDDVGGVPGYERFLEAIRTPSHPERQSLLDWVGGEFYPEKFDPKKIKFDSPSNRWKNAFEHEGTF